LVTKINLFLEKMLVSLQAIVKKGIMFYGIFLNLNKGEKEEI